MRNYLFFLLVFISSGCATQPIANSAAYPVPASRIIDARYSMPSQGNGFVTIKRDSGGFGMACSSRVFVNAMPIADLYPSEKIVMYLPAGDYIFSAWPNGACGGGMTEVEKSVKSGGQYNYRIGYGSNGDYTLNPTAF